MSEAPTWSGAGRRWPGLLAHRQNRLARPGITLASIWGGGAGQAVCGTALEGKIVVGNYRYGESSHELPIVPFVQERGLKAEFLEMGGQAPRHATDQVDSAGGQVMQGEVAHHGSEDRR